MVCGCCADKRKGELFKPHRERGCTDVVCLLLLIVAVGGLAAISYVAISAHPSLVDDLIYPTDSYGNNCGKPGSDTAELSKVLYPDLDSDIIANADLIATGQYLTFLTSVTRLCARACPAGVSLRGPSIYGGSGYPGGANATVPEHTYSFTTQDVFGRCFPLSSAFAEATSQLVSPTPRPALRTARLYPRASPGSACSRRALTRRSTRRSAARCDAPRCPTAPRRRRPGNCAPRAGPAGCRHRLARVTARYPDLLGWTPGSWLRHALGMSRSAAEVPMGGCCGAAVRGPAEGAE